MAKEKIKPEATQEAKKFVDPFAKGTTYADVVDALGSKTVAEYYDGLLEPDQLVWLENEIEHFKNKK